MTEWKRMGCFDLNPHGFTYWCSPGWYIPFASSKTRRLYGVKAPCVSQLVLQVWIAGKYISKGQIRRGGTLKLAGKMLINSPMERAYGEWGAKQSFYSSPLSSEGGLPCFSFLSRTLVFFYQMGATNKMTGIYRRFTWGRLCYSSLF